MNAYSIVLLLAFLVLAAVLLVRYVHAAVDDEFRRLARAESDPEFRTDELRRLDDLLAESLPLSADVKSTSGPPSAGWRAAAPVMLAAGVVLLWGAVFARDDRGAWLGGGVACCLLAACVMLLTLRRRKSERLARLLRYRADLRRLDGNKAMSAADLAELLKLTPWDDAAWSELSDDLASEGDLENALDAVRQASRLDPRYGEYRMAEASLALRQGNPEAARIAVDAWSGLDGVAADDPRLAVYRAAVELAEGRREEAAESVRLLFAESDDRPDYLDADAALREIKDLLAGNT